MLHNIDHYNPHIDYTYQTYGIITITRKYYNICFFHNIMVIT